ncbi:MAG: Crp/Fnr family transcriptional regulator [Bacteroidaceae bacterium]|nr:Crp/Fnr family transcriptional regulator [Bacteroidaceae bacterium]
MELTMYERILQLPLFQGLTSQELSEVMAHVRLDFVNFSQGDEIVIQGDVCKNLIYIISGHVQSEYQDPKGRFILTETLPNMRILEPYNMFGMYQKYSRTYLFHNDGCTLSIEKRTVLNRLMANNIVKINLLNIVSNRYQQAQRVMCEYPENTVKEKIVKFLLSFASVPKGQKELHIRMTDLGDIIHETRLNVSRTLNALEDKGLITLQRGGIIIPELQDLYK